MPTKLLLAALLLLAACDPKEGAARAQHPDSAGAIRRCAAGMARATSAPVREKATIIMAECRFLYARPACRDAWDAKPDEGTSLRVVRACRDAYCGDLHTPRPGLCTAWPAEDEDARAGWPELNAAILALDHGDPDATSRAFLANFARLTKVFIVGVGTSLPPVH
jgi:hypothetical protein